MEMTSERPELPQRVRKLPVTDGVHLAEHMLQRYRLVAERLREYLDGPERVSLDLEMDLTHVEVTEAIRAIGRETYPSKEGAKGGAST